eukprot:5939142-Pleurochrysis_carterae.AAC.1
MIDYLHSKLLTTKYSRMKVRQFSAPPVAPWVATRDYRNNPVTHEVEEAKHAPIRDTRVSDACRIYTSRAGRVLRSDPKGIDLMHHFPRVEDDPGKEEWLKPEKWSTDRVFHDVSRWEYDDPSKQVDRRNELEALKKWHTAHAESEQVRIGEVHRIGADL